MNRRTVFRRKLAAAFAAAGLLLAGTTALTAPAEAAPFLNTTTRVTASAATTTYGSPITFNAKVATGNFGLIITPSGSVKWTTTDSNGTRVLGTTSLSGCVVYPCTTSITTTALGAGNNLVTAHYLGDSYAKPSSGSVNVFVKKPPSAPQSLVATAGDHKVSLSWSAPADPGSSAVTGYQVFRSTTSGIQGAQVGTVTAPTTSYVDNTALNGTTYYYSVVATNSTNVGPPSAQAQATPVAGVAGAPVLSGPVSSLDQLKISWTAPASTSTITSYRIYRDTSAGAHTLLTTVSGSTLSYTDSTPLAPTTYYYRVTATNVAGEGAYSNEVNGVPVAPTVPCTPSLTATGQVGSTQMSWVSSCTGGRPITGYNLYRTSAALGMGTYTLIASGLPTGNYQDTTALVGQQYFYRATASNVVGESAPSSVQSATATSYSGPSSFKNTSCPAGSTCSSATATGSFGGVATDSSIQVESSSGAHTSSVAIGGPVLTGCVNQSPNVGLSATFNDTSTDAFKTVVYTLHGSDAQTWYNDNQVVFGTGDMCLGLGTPWYNGSTLANATWVPADGLYEGRVPLCVNSGATFLGGNHFSQPCVDEAVGGVSPNVTTVTFTFRLPPGDGKITGGH